MGSVENQRFLSVGWNWWDYKQETPLPGGNGASLGCDIGYFTITFFDAEAVVTM